jgi:hypothetical protein
MEDKKKKKGFWAKVMEKIDKKMKECDAPSSCCASEKKGEDKSCCSK